MINLTKTIKLIDLYVKIANGTPVKKVKYKSYVFEYTNSVHDYYYFDNCIGVGIWLFDEAKDLNDEVEIIEDTPKEDKKIEKIKMVVCDSDLIDRNHFVIEYLAELKYKINEIIDKINGGK